MHGPTIYKRPERPMCAVCGKAVDDVEYCEMSHTGQIRIAIKCHGQIQMHALSTEEEARDFLRYPAFRHEAEERKRKQLPADINMPLTEFYSMPIQSPEEMIIALMTRARLEGLEIDKEGRVDISIDMESARVQIIFKPKFASHYYGPSIAGIGGRSATTVNQMRVEWIDRMRRAGFPDNEIKEMLSERIRRERF